jgi:hypothetical protein
MFFHPLIDGGIPLNSAVESQQLRSQNRWPPFGSRAGKSIFH